MAPPPPPSWHGPSIPPPNFSVPPPNMCGGNFPRFSGPMHNQPSFPMGQGPRMPPPPQQYNMAVPPPNFRGGNHQNGNLGPRFNNGGGPVGPRTNPASTRPPAPTNQRPPGYVQDDIFGDTAPDVPCGFPHFNPHQPPPGMAPPNQMNHPPRGGGHRGGGGGGAGRGFGGQNGGPSPRGRGAFHGGMGRGGGGGQTRGGWGGNSNNINNGGGRGGGNNNNNNNSIGGRSGNNNNNNNGGFGGNNNNRGGNNINNNNNNNGGGQNGFQKKMKKQKVDKRELPENNKFFCDRCERGFKDEDKYNVHVSEHQKCTYKDCPFVAAPKLVQLHMSMQHTGGMAKKVYGVATEEDVKKWKEDRRKNFPTAANIKKKKELLEERIARGEVIETKDFSKMKRGRDQGRGRGRGKGRGRGRFQKGRRYDDKDDPDTDDDEDDGPPEEVKIRRTGAERTDKEATQAPTNVVDSTSTIDLTTPSTIDLTSPSTVDLTLTDSSPTKGLSLLTGYGSVSSDGDEDDHNTKEPKKTELKNTKKVSSLSSPLCVSSSASPSSPSPSLRGSGSAPKNQDSSHSHTANPSTSSTEGHPPTHHHNHNNDTTAARDQQISRSNNTLGEDSTEKLSEKNGIGDGTSGKEKSVRSQEGDEPKQDGDVAMETGGDTASSNVAGVNKGTKRGHGSKDGPRQKKPKVAPKPAPKSYTLLEKLLSQEIRRERNKILQCVHFIVKNKFFQGELTQ